MCGECVHGIFKLPQRPSMRRTHLLQPSSRPCLNKGLKQSIETSSLSQGQLLQPNVTAEKVVASQFIQITEHFVCATLARVFFNVPALFAACRQRNQRTKRPTTAAAFGVGPCRPVDWIPWLLSRIVLISQFIAIYKNMKNAQMGGKFSGTVGPPRK